MSKFDENTTALDFLKETATLKKTKDGHDKHGCYEVRSGDFEKFAATRGITKEVLTAIKNLTADLTNGSRGFLQDAVIAEIDRLDAAGEDPKSAVASIRIARGTNSDLHKLYAQKEFSNPSTKEKQTTYGYMSSKYARTFGMDKDYKSLVSSAVEKRMSSV